MKALLPFKLVYHEGYDLNLGPHVFPSQKFRLIKERLLADGFAAPEDFVSPEPASNDDLLLVHERGWIQRLKNGTLSQEEILQLEIPYSPEMSRAFWLAAGGTTLAARLALDEGVSFNVGGGFHHAFPDHGEGFCAINDIAVAIRKMQHDGKIHRAMVVDCDVHHGNGTAAIFAGDPAVFTLSIHQYNNYPVRKPPSTVDRKSTRLNSSHITISYAVFCLKKKKKIKNVDTRARIANHELDHELECLCSSCIKV